ncbi:jg15012, partial [Pararge aegeria aegeria]
YPPDGLLTFGKSKHDVAAEPHIIELDPLASDDCLDVLSPEDLFLLTT